MSGSSDSRTETSSSTTNTTGLAIDSVLDMEDALRVGAKAVAAFIIHSSAPVTQCCIQCGLQGLLIKGLVQAIDGAPRDEFPAQRLVCPSSDENDWYRVPAPYQLL